MWTPHLALTFSIAPEQNGSDALILVNMDSTVEIKSPLMECTGILDPIVSLCREESSLQLSVEDPPSSSQKETSPKSTPKSGISQLILAEDSLSLNSCSRLRLETLGSSCDRKADISSDQYPASHSKQNLRETSEIHWKFEEGSCAKVMVSTLNLDPIEFSSLLLT